MGEFRRIKYVHDVHISEALSERIVAVLGETGLGMQLRGEAWAYVEGNHALGVGGIEPIWTGRHVLWSYQADLKFGDWRRILRFTRLRLARAIERPDVRRIEATALLSEGRYCRFLEKGLGFMREGVLMSYSPEGEDMMMFAKVAI